MNWGREALDLYEKNLNKVGKIEYRGEFPASNIPLNGNGTDYGNH